MEAYLSPLVKTFISKGDPQRAAASKKYLRDQFEFLGIDTKTRRDLIRAFLDQYGKPPVGDMREISFFLWQLQERDFQHAAIDILDKMKKDLRREDIEWLEELVIRKSWWDTVDALSSWIIGTYFRLYPGTVRHVTGRWIKSDNIWLQRTCLIFQLKYKEKTDTGLLEEYIGYLAHKKEFFIRKAIGWILREYSKTDKQWVRDFLASVNLSPLSVKEASKYI
ncbi:MAG: DNA alkylation repair protein [Bacteroidales bacterium]|jgi:3-methyladenine DNA glycosylase AlkD